LTWLCAVLLVWAGIIFAKIVNLQVVSHKKYAALAIQQQRHLVALPAPRGSLSDRNAQPLAVSAPVDSVFVNPLQLPDLQIAADILSPILSLPRTETLEKLQAALDDERGFLWIKRKITREESERLRSLNLEWIEFQRESRRYYPKGSLAAHVLGAVDHEERGNAGIELALENDLHGRAGKARLLTDVKRRGIESETSAEPLAGMDLTLTIDERIQFAAERDLKEAVEGNRCTSGSVVVMDPHTGDTLALASFPTFDPAVPPEPWMDGAERFNHAVSVPFEPGSVFKVITLAAALETTALTPESPINCGGGILRLPGRIIHEAKNGFGSLTVSQVLEKSSNIGAIQIGMKVGREGLLDYVRRFGFGRQVGLPLPAESGGVVRPVERWGTTSLASIAMGHEVSTTTVQLAQAVSVVANGGLLVKPRLVLRRSRAGKPVPAQPPDPPKRVLQAATAITMRQMMEGVVLHGTGTRARLSGWTSGGKTGSAQIFDLVAKRYTHKYNASFMGFAPVTNPAIAVVVTLNGAAEFGGKLAAPVFGSVASEALRVLDVPKDLPELPERGRQAARAAREEEAEEDDLAIADLGVSSVLEESEERGPRVPNFRGKSMRAVGEEAAGLGLPVVLEGSGTARAQAPLPGSVLLPGERVRVEFKR
jgi:cell division protein FtsI (penicillin-binding protein 3)